MNNPVLNTPIPQKKGILDRTLADILKTNTQAQSIVMKAMRITPEKFAEMLTQTSSNKLMQTPIRDLIRGGIVRKAVEQKKINQQVVNQGMANSDTTSQTQAQKKLE